MAVFLLLITIVGAIGLACYLFWYLGNKKKIDPGVESAVEEQKIKNAILGEIYKNAGRKKDKVGSEILKVTLITKLNVFPQKMTEYLKDLIKKRMIIESADSVSLTTFGVEHYEVFLKQPPTKKKK